MKIVCRECGRDFDFAKAEQEFYQQKEDMERQQREQEAREERLHAEMGSTSFSFTQKHMPTIPSLVCPSMGCRVELTYLNEELSRLFCDDEGFTHLSSQHATNHNFERSIEDQMQACCSKTLSSSSSLSSSSEVETLHNQIHFFDDFALVDLAKIPPGVNQL